MRQRPRLERMGKLVSCSRVGEVKSKMRSRMVPKGGRGAFCYITLDCLQPSHASLPTIILSRTTFHTFRSASPRPSHLREKRRPTAYLRRVNINSLHNKNPPSRQANGQENPPRRVVSHADLSSLETTVTTLATLGRCIKSLLAGGTLNGEVIVPPSKLRTNTKN